MSKEIKKQVNEIISNCAGYSFMGKDYVDSFDLEKALTKHLSQLTTKEPETISSHFNIKVAEQYLADKDGRILELEGRLTEKEKQLKEAIDLLTKMDFMFYPITDSRQEIEQDELKSTVANFLSSINRGF